MVEISVLQAPGLTGPCSTGNFTYIASVRLVMKTIGLLGGMSWESTVTYYRAINEGVKNSLGGLHSAQVAMYSVDFEPIEKLQHAGQWDDRAYRTNRDNCM